MHNLYYEETPAETSMWLIEKVQVELKIEDQKTVVCQYFRYGLGSKWITSINHYTDLVLRNGSRGRAVPYFRTRSSTSMCRSILGFLPRTVLK